MQCCEISHDQSHDHTHDKRTVTVNEVHVILYTIISPSLLYIYTSTAFSLYVHVHYIYIHMYRFCLSSLEAEDSQHSFGTSINILLV